MKLRNKAFSILFLLIFSSFFLFAFFTSIQVAKAQKEDWFKDITSETNLDNTKGRRLYFADVNNDNYPDLVLHDNSSRSQLQLFLNLPDPNGDGRVFKDTTEWSNINASPIDSLNGRKSTGVVMGDVNNDGHVDLLSCFYYHRRENYTDKGDRCACLLNDGTGQFELKENSGLAEAGLINATGLALLDYNQDGNIDLYISSWSKDHTSGIFDHDYLFEGQGDGTFSNVSEEAGLHAVDPYPMYGINIMDWNNDGHQDVAPSPYCRHGGDFWKNTGTDSFVDVSSEINYDAHTMSGDNGQTLCQWAADPSDFDNDGDVDFYLSLVHGGSGFGEGHSTLVINEGKAQDFETNWDLDRVQKENPKPSHHGDFDADWLDINNDGLVDLVTGQGAYNPGEDRIYFFLQEPDHYFDEITDEMGMVSTFDQPNKVQAIDYDLDGDDDLMVSTLGNNSKISLLENTIGDQNNSVSVKLLSPDGVNEDAIGARIYVYADTLTRMRDIYAGEGNMGGQSPFILNFGVGAHTIDSIEVRWPDNQVANTMVKEPPMNQLVTIEGESTGLPEAANRQSYEVFPNPVEETLHIRLKKEAKLSQGKIQLYDLWGKAMEEQVLEAKSAEHTLNMTHLKPGFYVLHIIKDNKTVKIQKVIKR